ncbi:hypothetical protein BU26DRAFT_70551 [Trematosphaeria pertusa]|uniref:N-acetyltransferase domain-containing protein n=1 Tax=Trematosphaeria pertusa TaxID=390896 RepID=A0A6A6I5M4_9PLEO|nr:uncharacterized protein BU26DRAFT_70551 [Trematosphaeria pertusa]KAF2245529.1 hypothetical protein BU26DRAFT_70551 [Trematosphaeria pertusa]
MSSDDAKPSRPEITISSTTENPPAFLDLLTQAFLTDPAYTFFLHRVPWYLRPAALYHLFGQNLIACSVRRHGSSKATFYAASTEPNSSSNCISSPQSCAVILHPGMDVLDLGIGGWWKMLCGGALKAFWYAGFNLIPRYVKHFESQTIRAKKATFAKGETYYYMWHIATDAAHRGKGLAPALIREVQERAQSEGKALWTEASSPMSRVVYAKCGFVDVRVEGLKGSKGGEFRLGVGVVDESGERAGGEGAVGVPVFPMVWWPEGYVKGGERK